MMRISPDELPNRAFQLAYFLHRERKTALEIATRALNKLQLAATAQGKRLYYRLTGRSDSRKARSKVSMGEPQLLQRLVYVESEEYERLKEEAALKALDRNGVVAARRSDLVVYFIKHLVRITTRRNSFYVTLGLSRLLYNYSTPEAMELYNLVIQDPDRVHDDYYYRSRKGVLLKELKERFGSLIEVTKGARGEQRWRLAETAARNEALVRECLLWFTPWATPCVVPERFDPLNETIDRLNFQGHHPDDEHEVEVNRMHATLHPECFARLAAANLLPPPDERLELPHFFVDSAADDDDTPRTPPDLSKDEVNLINSLLAQEALRRKAASAGFLRVMVDGSLLAQIDTKSSRSTKFSVDEAAELIEVYSRDQQGDLLLATHLLSLKGSAPQTSFITIEGGQKLSFRVEPLIDEATESAQVTVTIEEPAAARAAVTALGRFVSSFSDTSFGWWKPAVALAAFVLLIGGAWWVWTRQQKQPEVVKVTPPVSAPGVNTSPNPRTATAQGSPGVTEREASGPPNPITSTPTPLIAKRETKPRATDENFVERTLLPAGVDETDPGETATRGTWSIESMGKPLNEVRRVYLQSPNESESLLQELRSQFESGGTVSLSDAQQADAALKLSVRQHPAGEGRIIATVRAVNARGFVVWPARPRTGSWRYAGRPKYVAERIVRDLTADISRAKK